MIKSGECGEGEELLTEIIREVEKLAYDSQALSKLSFGHLVGLRATAAADYYLVGIVTELHRGSIITHSFNVLVENFQFL